MAARKTKTTGSSGTRTRGGKKSAAGSAGVRKAATTSATSKRTTRAAAKKAEQEQASSGGGAWGGDDGQEQPSGGGSGQEQSGGQAPEADPEVTDEPITELGDLLAEVEETIEVQFGNEEIGRGPGHLRAVLRVHKDAHSENTRLGYHATFYLTGIDREPATEVEVGSITSWRINRDTVARPNVRSDWGAKLIRPTHQNVQPRQLGETALCLQSVYTKKLQPRTTVTHLRTNLAENGILFIEMIFNSLEYQRRGLLRPMLQSFRRLLSRLPEWFAFQDTILLVPSRPAGEQGNVWGEMTEQEVENALRAIYERTDNYQVCVIHKHGDKTRVVVMGRLVQ